MSFDQILYITITTVVAVLGFMLRSHMQRINNIEKNMDSKFTEEQTRQLLNDRLDPIKEGLQEVKEKMDKLYDILLK